MELKNSKNFLLDSSFLVSLWLPDDSNHENAARLFLEISTGTLLVHPYVIQEVITLLTYKRKTKEVETFLRFVSESRNIIILPVHIKNEIEVFKKYKQKMSFTDVVLVGVANMLGVELVTFDKQMLRLFKKK